MGASISMCAASVKGVFLSKIVSREMRARYRRGEHTGRMEGEQQDKQEQGCCGRRHGNV